MRNFIVCCSWLVLLTLAGCGYSLNKLKHADPKGSAFQNALAKHYLNFSETEATEYDWIDSQYFASKGLRLAYGHNESPEQVKEWRIPASMVATMNEAYDDLMRALTDHTKTNQPDVAANAQFYFDCWLEQQEENWQSDDIAVCRDNFYKNLKELTGNTPSQEEVTVSDWEEDTTAQEEQEPLPPVTSYMIFFDHNSDRLNSDATISLQQIVKDLITLENTEIVLNGYTDSSGTTNYNLSLSKRRASAVKQALIDGGILPKRVFTNAYGEMNPQVKTGDGVRQPKNRRVEIMLGQ